MPPETKPSRSASSAPSTTGTARPIDHRADAGRPAHLVEVAEQAEAGDVGGGQRAPAASAASAASRFSWVITSTAAGKTSPVCLCRLLSNPTPIGLVSVIGSPGFGGVVAQQPVRIGDAGDRHPVLGFRIVDGMAADHRAAGLLGHRQPTTQHLGEQLHRQHAARPADQVDRDHRTAAHRVDVGERVGGGDAAPVVGVVDDRGEEVGGGQHGEARRAPARRRRRRRRPGRPARSPPDCPTRPATASSSSPGGILQAQPPPCA